MAPISLKIVLEDGAVTRKVKFNSTDTVQLAHQIVKEKVLNADNKKEYALFLPCTDDDLSGVWLENHRALEYYMLRDGDSLEYICKMRNLRVRLLDDTVKTLQVDQAKNIADLIQGICGRIGISNWDEYGLCRDNEESEDSKELKPGQTSTLRPKHNPKDRDVEMEQLSKKLKTDDNVEWLDQYKTLREMAVGPNETLLLKRRLFYSDRNVDSRDPVQLNLLYVQTRDAILNGTHPVTEDQAADCKVRWINIRDVYRRILKKNIISGRILRKYKYEDELSFMKPFYRDVVISQDFQEKEDEDWNVSQDNVEQLVDNGNEPSASFQSEDSDETQKLIKPKKRRKGKKKREKFLEVEVDEVKPSTSNFENPTHELDPSDAVDAFLLSIGATLKTFSPYHLNLAKSKIFAIVQEHDLQQIVQKETNDDTKISTTEALFLHE